MVGKDFEDEEAALQAFKDSTSGSLGTLGHPFRFLRRGRSGPKGLLIKNSDVNRLQVQGHWGHKAKDSPSGCCEGDGLGRRTLSSKIQA